MQNARLEALELQRSKAQLEKQLLEMQLECLELMDASADLEVLSKKDVQVFSDLQVASTSSDKTNTIMAVHSDQGKE
jgi:hypothetical protein